VYGTEQPFCYAEHYDLIDIPIHFFISMNDTLIRADDVLEHYNRLKASNPSLARITVFEGFGHNDFTYASHDSVAKEFKKALKKFINQHEISSLASLLGEISDLETEDN
jgi:alpha-beta hydrolase superfamily lysophospholipase